MASVVGLSSSRSNCQDEDVHVVAIPYPGRGHVNCMVSTCRLLAAQNLPGLLITLVATEEWLAILASDSPALPSNIQLRPIPNVLPSETTRGNDWPGFFQAVFTKMEAPVARLLEELEEEKPVECVVADVMLLPWVVGLGRSRSIPVVALWPMSSAMLLPIFDYTGVHQIDVKDWKSIDAARRVAEAVSWVPKTQFLLIASIHELEPHATGAIKAHLQFPVYTVGPCIPYMSTRPTNVDYHCRWLDSKPRDSVLFVSLGSHWVVSEAQTNEIASGLRGSGVHFLWSARSKGQVCGDKGLIVPWCDQLRVLCHPSIGAFLTHCGWNSTMESVFAGVVMIAFPIAADQPHNAKLIAEDWKIGVRLRREEGSEEGLVKGEEIAGAVKFVMDLEGDESKEMRTRAEGLREACKRAIEIGLPPLAKSVSFKGAYFWAVINGENCRREEVHRIRVFSKSGPDDSPEGVLCRYSFSPACTHLLHLLPVLKIPNVFGANAVRLIHK